MFIWARGLNSVSSFSTTESCVIHCVPSGPVATVASAAFGAEGVSVTTLPQNSPQAALSTYCSVAASPVRSQARKSIEEMAKNLSNAALVRLRWATWPCLGRASPD